MKTGTCTAGLLASLIFMFGPLWAYGGVAPGAWQTRVSRGLLLAWSRQRTPEAEKLSSPPNRYVMRVDSAGRVQIDVSHECGAVISRSAYAKLGFTVHTSVNVPPMCVDEGWAPFQAIPSLAAIPNITLVDLPIYAHTGVIQHYQAPLPKARSAASPSSPVTRTATGIDAAGITIMHANQYIQQTGSNGSGVTVGIISDDATNLATIQARGELPANIMVYPGGTNPAPTDEGTMMLEEVHAIAPGAALAFCGPETEAEYVNCLQSFTAARIDIAADDLDFETSGPNGQEPEDLMSAQSVFAQGVANLLKANPSLVLFSSADNQNQAYWQGVYNPSAFTFAGKNTLTCSANGQVDSYLENFGSQLFETLTLNAPLTAPLVLAWADPYGHNVSDFDLYILDSSFNVLACVSATGISPNAEGFAPPIPAGTYNFLIATPDQSLAGKFLKLIAYADGAGTMNITTNGSINSPNKFVPGVQTIGAVNGADGIGNTIEPYSGTGPIQLEFPTPTAVQAPVFVAPDCVDIDDAGTDFAQDPFCGTSAATPNAAAVAALLESAFQGAPSSVLLSAMRTGAFQLGATVPDGVYGFGRLDAIGALNAVPAPAISAIGDVTIPGGQSSGDLPVALAGTGNLSLGGTSTNTSLVSFGASGNVSIDPATCGTTTNSCALIVTPSVGETGTANITIQVNDGAGRTASTDFTVIVDKPAAPTISGATNQSIQQGTAFTPESLTLTGVEPLTVSLTSSDGAVVPSSDLSLSQGCGTTSLNCTVTIAGNASSSGASTVTAAVMDPYGQSAQSNFTLGVNSPSGKGGGGAVSWVLLLLFSALAWARLQKRT